MTDFRKILLAVCPRGAATVLDGFSAALPQLTQQAELNTDKRLAAFIGQCAEESAGFATVVEYGSGAAYERRRDLGNLEPGDGRRFKGRGLIQITGRDNYRVAGSALGLPLEDHPEQAAVFPAAAMTAGWFWTAHQLNILADSWNIPEITRKINGGENGLAARLLYSVKAARALSLTETAADAIADPTAALTKAAAAQKAAARRKGVAAVAVASPTVAATMSPAKGGGVPLSALVCLGVIALVAGLWAFLEIRKHQNAARILSDAARAE